MKALNDSRILGFSIVFLPLKDRAARSILSRVEQQHCVSEVFTGADRKLERRGGDSAVTTDFQDRDAAECCQIMILFAYRVASQAPFNVVRIFSQMLGGNLFTLDLSQRRQQSNQIRTGGTETGAIRHIG